MIPENKRCNGRYPIPQTSPPRDEPFDVTYRCALPEGHDGPHRATMIKTSPRVGKSHRKTKE
jgi:hypothetical protein